MTPEKFLERHSLATVLDGMRDQRRIVFTNGCFDLLHVGHIRLLQAARRSGDVLVVGLNSDASIHRLKGPARPVVPEAERAEILAALACVDWITLFDEDTPIETIAILRPHVHVKGGDYSPFDIPEADVLRKIGARTHIVPLVPDRSTSRLLDLIQASETDDETSRQSSPVRANEFLSDADAKVSLQEEEKCPGCP